MFQFVSLNNILSFILKQLDNSGSLSNCQIFVPRFESGMKWSRIYSVNILYSNHYRKRIVSNVGGKTRLIQTMRNNFMIKYFIIRLI